MEETILTWDIIMIVIVLAIIFLFIIWLERIKDIIYDDNDED